MEELHLPHPPTRVVSLVPSVTGSLFDLGLGQTVVGVTDYCVYPPEAVARLPKVGGTKNPDPDKVLALKPDLVIANREENRRDDVVALRAAGVPVWVTFPCTVREALDLLWATIRLFGVPQLGQTLTALEKSLEWTRRAAEAQPPVPVFVPIWREPGESGKPVSWWMTANRATYLDDVLRVCGAVNVFADRERLYPLAADLNPERVQADPPDPQRDTRYPRVTPAEMAARAPHVILLPSEPFPFDGSYLADFDDFPDVPAAKNQRIHLLDGSVLTWPGTRLAQALADLPNLLRPGVC